MTIQEEAVRIHGQGCNCAQSVLAACGKYTGLEPETALRVAAGFGGGVRSGEICGAISGAVMTIGLTEKDPRRVAALTKQCVESFRQNFGCVRCLELKQNRVSCDALIAYGAQYAEDLINNK
ncbi:MAG: C-GCAxxG-C-C family protein [Oscillospiraceae bacterium]|nr:C-GCAxxG-C-C family protein [Oscillospiraceae bacterium]